MIVKMLLVDACTDGLFSGGRAAVAFLRNLGQEVFLAALADELGFPVTAYILPHQDEFITRCFAPHQGEIDAHNYAALAAAHAIYGVGLAPADKPVTLHGRGGILKLFKEPAQPEGAVSLHLAHPRTSPATPDVTDRLRDMLGLNSGNVLMAEYVGADQLVICCLAHSFMDAMNFDKIGHAFPQTRLTFSAPLESASLPGYALRSFSRFGEPENAPMSVAVHAVLGAFWAERLHKTQLEVHYLSPRTSRLRVDKNPGGGFTLSANVNTIFRADPVLKELSGKVADDIF